MKKSLLFMGLCISVLTYGQIPTANLVGEYNFTQGSFDDAAGSNHLNQIGSALAPETNRAGGSNRAISLNGDYLQRTSTNTGTRDLSVSFWIKTSTNDANRTVIIDQSERTSDADVSTQTGWYAYLKHGKIGIAGNSQWLRNGAFSGYLGYHYMDATTNIADGNWHHVTLTIDSFNGHAILNGNYAKFVRHIYRVYIDNTLENTYSKVQTFNYLNTGTIFINRFVNLADPITIGNNKDGNSTNSFQESIDDIRFYSRTITAAEVTALFNETSCAGSTATTAVAKNITIQLDVNGNALIAASDINDGSVNTCGEPALVSVDKSLFSCADLGANTVTLTADDGEGHMATTTAIVTVDPLITVVTKNSPNLSVALDAAGSATIMASDVDNGSSSSCAGVLTLSLDKTSFTCADLGSQSVTLTVADANGNMATGSATVVVTDEIPPTVITQDISVMLGSNGKVSITPGQIDNGSTDNCGTLTLSLDKTQFNCDDLGINTVILTATASGSGSAATLISSGSATVTVTSSIANQAVTTTSSSTFCPDGSPAASTIITTGGSQTGLNYYLRKSSDNTAVDGPVTGTGSGLIFNTGALSETTKFNVYALPESIAAASTSLDFDGVNDKVATTYVPSATTELTIEGWILPRSSNYKRIISNFNGSGNTIGDIVLDTYNASANNGKALRIYLVGSGNVGVSHSVPNVLTLNAWNHVAVTFDHGLVKFYVGGIQVGSTTVGLSSLSSTNSPLHIGEDIGGTNFEYFNGNMDEIRIWDTVRTPAELIANKDKCLIGNEAGLSAYFNFEDGNGTTLTELVRAKSGTLLNMHGGTDWVDGTTLTCSYGCGVQMSTEVTIGDNIAPTAISKNITVQYENNGKVTIVASDINNGSIDNCTSSANLIYSLDNSSFTCDDLGTNTVVLTVTDEGGNSATASATVTITSSINSEVVSTESTNICQGESTIISIPNSVSGVNYYLRNDANNAFIGSTVVGTGSAIDFNTGVLNANTTFNVYGEDVSAVVNQVLNFDGSNDYISAGAPAFDYHTAYTMETWVKAPLPGSSAFRPILHIGTSTISDIEIYVQKNTNRLTVIHNRGRSGTVSYQYGSPPNNVWYHLAVTYDGARVRVYYNGVERTLIAGGGNSTLSKTTGAAMRIANHSNTAVFGSNAYMIGQLDDFRMWNTARTATEISASKDICLKGDEVDLETYYNFDEAIGTIVTDLANGSDGMLINMDPATDRIASTSGITCVSQTCGIEMANTVTVSTNDTTDPTVITRDIVAALGNNPTVTITTSDINNGSTDNCTEEASLIYSLDVTTFDINDLGDRIVTLFVEDASGNIGSAMATVTVIDKLEQNISFTAVEDKVYGTSDFVLTASSDASLPVTISVISGPATISGSIVTVTGVGTITLEASQSGNNDYAQANPVQSTFEVTKAALTATVSSMTISYGDAIPNLIFDYGGFVNGESSAVLTSEPTISTMATASSDAGTYDIELADGSADNYDITLVNGYLIISKVDQTISATEIPSKVNDDQPFEVTASASSGLALNYTISGPASMVDNTVTLSGSRGEVIITISQSGDKNYNAAADKVLTFEVRDICETLEISSILSTDVTCAGNNNGNIDITVAGGTAPYSYSWSNKAESEDISGLAEGNYTVIVTDAKNCTTSTQVTISEPSILQAIPSSTSVLCFGSDTGSIDVSVSGGTAPYSYSWSNGETTEDISGLLAGSYLLTVTDVNSCVTAIDVEISEPASAIQISSTTTDVIAGNDGATNLTVSGGTAPYTYSWSNGANTEDLVGVAAGDYTVTVTDSNSCSQSLSMTVGDIVLATERDLINTKINYYPNPVREQLTIEASFDKISAVEIHLLDMTGRSLISKKMLNVDHISTKLKTGGMNPGQYLLVIKNDYIQKVGRITITK